jgi:hypothetical protein
MASNNFDVAANVLNALERRDGTLQQLS